MSQSDRAQRLAGFEELGLLSETRRAGNWSDDLNELTGISVDSRETQAGHLFAALPGSNVHGAAFIATALHRGAVAILTDETGLTLAEGELGPLDVPVILSDAPRQVLARAAARFYSRQPETIVAVTGTNGKTSVASFARQIWEHLGLAAVNFGTVGVEGCVSAKLQHTTPDPLTLHRLLADLKDQGVTHAAMEASSHGLDQYRLDGVHLAAAGFTNLSRDHLDYHHDFESYFTAKAGLFQRVLPKSGVAVINLDDAHAGQLLDIVAARGQPVITMGRDPAAKLRLLDQRFDGAGQDILFLWDGARHAASLSLIGGFQAHNALLAAALVIGAGAAPGDVFNTLSELQTVRGRMERAATRQNGASVFVDFAHTPDALRTALDALRPHVMGRLLVVFGAGGDRDRGKRPLMGQAAAQGADMLFVTDDNPRSETPAAIRADIMPGCPEATEIGDRAEAILTAVDALQPGDALLIAGKGHETGQIVGDDVLPFDDVEQASMAVAALEGSGA